MHITLLIAVTETLEDTNYLRLGNEMFRRGFTVDCCDMDSIAMLHSKVLAKGFRLTVPLEVGAPFPQLESRQLEESDVVWTLSLGMRQSFLDKLQLLKCLESSCQLVNSLDALMHFKSKYFLANHPHIFHYPETFSSTNPEQLRKVIIESGGKWIAKPPAGSLGRDIFLLSSADPNLNVILENMTGPDADQYCLLQKYVDEVATGEKRVLIADGEPVGQYIRHANQDHRTNVSTGASVQNCELSAEEYSYCKQIGSLLNSQGARFVGVDLAYPWVIEFNVVNPGGIQTLIELGSQDLSEKIIDQIFPNSAMNP